jgi:hypothetical protein
MKKTVCALVWAGMMAGMAFGETVLYSGRDKFNDNVRDRTKWSQASWRTGRFQEQNGRLYYDSMGASASRQAAWYWKSYFNLIGGDLLESSVLITSPKFSAPLPDSHVALGLGFANGGTTMAVRHFDVVVQQYESETRIVAESLGGGVSSRAMIFSLPQAANPFYLIIRYSALTGKVTIWQRATDNSWTLRVGKVNLAEWWGVSLGNMLTLRPYVLGMSNEAIITPADNYYMDNFSAKMFIP